MCTWELGQRGEAKVLEEPYSPARLILQEQEERQEN